MKRTVCAFCVMPILLALVQVSSAQVKTLQVSTGTPRFSSMGGGPFDAVNLGNLNAHFSIPVLHKAGRGIPFSYDLSYDSSIWAPVTTNGTTTWTPVTSWGWSGSTQPAAGWVSYDEIDTFPIQNCQLSTYQNYVYHDGFGSAHRFPGKATWQFGIGGHSCTSIFRGFTAYTSDGSAYYLNINNNTGVGTLTAKDGSAVAAPFSEDSGGSAGAGGITDSNGNKITVNGSGQFFDTLSSTTPVLTVAGSGTPSSPITLTYTPPSGSNVAYKVNYTAYTVKTAFGFASDASPIQEYSSASAVNLVSSIALPDDTISQPDRYTFTYEAITGSCTLVSGTTQCVTGRIASVTLPTGGTITYTYSGGTHNTGIYSDGSTAGLTRMLSPTSSCTPNGCWQYVRALVSGTPGPGSTWTTTITDPTPQQNVTVVNFAEDSTVTNTNSNPPTTATYNFYETQRQVYQGSISPSNLLATTIHCYNGVYTTCTTDTVSSPISSSTIYSQLPNGNTRASSILYNGSFSGSGLVSDDQEFGYGVTVGSAPTTTFLVRETSTTYAILGNGIIYRPARVTVKDWTSGTAVTVASTIYTYDQGTPTTTTGTPQHIAITGSRGNLTTLATQVNTSTTLYRQFTYYDTGMPNNSTDVDTSSSTTCSSKPSICTTYNYSSTNNASCGNSFVTSISEPLGLTRSIAWSCTGGVTTQVTDENLNTVSTSPTDPAFWRLTGVTDQANNQTTIAYSSHNAVEAALVNFNGGSSVSDVRMTGDGFGRPILTQTLQGPSLTTYDSVETDYDGLGQLYRTTLPFSAQAGVTNSTAPATITTYDALGRVLTTTDANGGQVSNTYINNDVLQKVSGAQIFEKQLEYDGLGRLASVCEMTQLPGSGTCGQNNQVSGYWTVYTYDALGNLLTVTQNAQTPPTNLQTRSFTYDMLSRVISESNPETGNNGANGTVTYTYDSISPCGDGSNYSYPGNLVQKRDNAGHVTCYSYDAAHHVIQEGNSSVSNTIIRKFFYNSESSYPTGVTVNNGKTRMIEAQTINTTNLGVVVTDEFFSYSPRGELTDVYESTPHSGGLYHTTASYWPTGILKTLGGIPGVPTIYYGASNGSGLDPEGRVTKVTASSGTNPVTGVTYSPISTTNYLGALTGVTFGSGDSDTFTYDSNTMRLNTYTFGVNGNADAGQLTWNSNGTLAQLVITDHIPGTSDSQNCSYSYDDLRRVSSASCGALWSQTFTYDSFGNVKKSGSSSFLPVYSATQNQITSITGVNVSYDANGNLLQDNLNSYTWDPNWGNMLTVTAGSTTVSATYDALGRMVEKNQGGTYTELVYGPTGAKLATTSGQGLIRAFVPLPGGATGIYTSSGLAYYRHSDWLGSSRLTSTAVTPTSMYSSSAYAPFGEQFGSSGNADASFTGQDQDTISDLYDFPVRRYSPSQGRWVSPDPLGRGAVTLTRPQSWNRYAYVNNNPLSAVDSMGTNEDGNCGDDGDSNGGGDCGLAGGGGDGISWDWGGGFGWGGGDIGTGMGSGGCTQDDNGNVHCDVIQDTQQVTVTATVPDIPCVVIIGGVGDSQDDPDLNAAASNVGAVYQASWNSSWKAVGLAGAAGNAFGCGDGCHAAGNLINELEAANPQGVLLVGWSGGGGTINQAANANLFSPSGIVGVIYMAPGSPAGYSISLNNNNTFTFTGTGELNALVNRSNSIPGLGAYSDNFYAFPPGRSATIPCSHNFMCFWDNTIGSTIISFCNGSGDGPSGQGIPYPGNSETDRQIVAADLQLSPDISTLLAFRRIRAVKADPSSAKLAHQLPQTVQK